MSVASYLAWSLWLTLWGRERLTQHYAWLFNSPWQPLGPLIESPAHSDRCKRLLKPYWSVLGFWRHGIELDELCTHSSHICRYIVTSYHEAIGCLQLTHICDSNTTCWYKSEFEDNQSGYLMTDHCKHCVVMLTTYHCRCKGFSHCTTTAAFLRTSACVIPWNQRRKEPSTWNNQITHQKLSKTNFKSNSYTLAKQVSLTEFKP